MTNEAKGQSDIRDYLANERTFLSWIRTSIGIMAFGFVIEKFALFIEKISLFLNVPSDESHNFSPSVESSSVFGITLVALGALICILALVKYKKTQRQIEKNNYHPSMLLDLMLALSVLAIAVFIVIYLVRSF